MHQITTLQTIRINYHSKHRKTTMKHKCCFTSDLLMSKLQIQEAQKTKQKESLQRLR